MRKIMLTPIVVAIFAIQSISAQVVAPSGTIDSTIMVCDYVVRQCLDTALDIESDNSYMQKFRLEIGKTCSKYYHPRTDQYERIKSDPKLWEAYSAQLNQALARSSNRMMDFKPLSLEEPEVVYSNYPKGRRTVQDAVFTDRYIYSEDNDRPEWKILPDTADIMGYTCHKATCHYRGRDYVAWFSSDIPTDKGPWKFSGLPGLIFKIHDVGKHYIFELQSLKQEVIPIEYTEHKGIKYNLTDRKKLLRMKAKMKRIGVSGYAQMSTTGSMSVNSTDFGGGDNDLLETDYK